MRTLLFLDYWSLNEPLTQATVLPTLEMVLHEGLADRIVLLTVERGSALAKGRVRLPQGVVHIPLLAHRGWPRPIARALDILRMVPRVAKVVRQEKAFFIMARGVVAGGIAHFVHRRTSVPYAVDYFEPHADYMVDVGEWKRGGLLYRGLRYLIASQLRTARTCITVTRNYRDRLVKQGAGASRLLVAPCPVDAGLMAFDVVARHTVREKLGWGSATIGIYVGKFGGLYHRQQAFRAFVDAQREMGHGSGLIILTPVPAAEVIHGLRAAGFTGDRVLVMYADHGEVPRYLSAADFAFAPYRGTPSSACISPMKIGEYWANGLPVILTRGVGDDSSLIDADPFAGALFDPEGNDLGSAVKRVLGVLNERGQRELTARLAVEHRSMDRTREAYRSVLSFAGVGEVPNGTKQ